MKIGDKGYIYYNDKILQVTLVETHGDYKVVATEENELLGIPVESGTTIFSTREECERYNNCPWAFFTPQERR